MSTNKAFRAHRIYKIGEPVEYLTTVEGTGSAIDLVFAFLKRLPMGRYAVLSDVWDGDKLSITKSVFEVQEDRSVTFGEGGGTSGPVDFEPFPEVNTP